MDRVAPARVGTPEWDALTEQRSTLIYKKNREGLSEAEAIELARLQQISREAISEFSPPSPVLDATLEQLSRREADGLMQ